MITCLSLLFICAFSYYLIDCPRYDDGVFGRLALATMSLSSAVGLLQGAFYGFVFDPVSQLIFMAVAVFEGRHIYKIHKLQHLKRIDSNGNRYRPTQ